MTRRSAPAGNLLDRGARLRVELADDNRDAGLMIPAFSSAISRSVLPEEFLMVESDRGDGGRDRRDDVRRIEAAAEPDFEHGHLDPGAPKQLEGHRRGYLEERRLHREDAFDAQLVDGVADIRMTSARGSVRPALRRSRTVP